MAPRCEVIRSDDGSVLAIARVGKKLTDDERAQLTRIVVDFRRHLEEAHALEHQAPPSITKDAC